MATIFNMAAIISAMEYTKHDIRPVAYKHVTCMLVYIAAAFIGVYNLVVEIVLLLQKSSQPYDYSIG